MGHERWVTRGGLILATVVFILLSNWGAAFGQQQVDSLLIPLPATRSMVNDPFVIQQRPVAFNPAYLLRKSRSVSPLTLDLFDGEQITLEAKRIEQSSDGRVLFIGQAAGYPLSDVTFAWQGNTAAGTINLGTDVYRLRHVANGVHSLEQLPAEYLPMGEPIIPDMPTHPSRTAEHQHSHDALHISDSAEAEEKVHIIDVLVLYTDSSQKIMGGSVGTQNTIDLALAESNSGFEASGVNVRFQVVHSHKVDLVEGGNSFSKMLGELTQKDDGSMDEIHALRDHYGADVVTLIVNRPLLCGKTYQNRGPSMDFSELAFSVIHYACATGYYSFAHEIGHNMGSQHDQAHANQPPAFSYSYGFQDPANRFRTIMSYNCAAACPRINRWSNPNLNYEGMGPHGGHGADNHRSLIQMAPSVSQFRSRTLQVDQPIEINFQPGTASSGDQLASALDNGGSVQLHPNRLVYGWSADFTETEASASETKQDAGQNRAASFIHAVAPKGEKAIWSILAPTGTYQVKVISGAPHGGVLADLLIEDHLINVSTNPDTQRNPAGFFETTTVVDVADGHLSISGTANETILGFVEITPLAKFNQITSLDQPNIIFLPVVVR